MTIAVHPIIAGSNSTLELQFMDSRNDSERKLIGFTNFSATAKNTETGHVVPMESVIVTDAVLGKIDIEWSADAFLAPGLYSVQIVCLDATGRTAILPSEGGQLLIRVGARNTT